METKQDLPIIAFGSQREWEDWLAAHHATARGLWLKIAKKDSGIASVSYAEALEGALCYGWIDGQRAAYDGQYFLQKFTPRGRRSKWSRINRDKVTALEQQGRLQPAGQAQVEQARQDGRWDAAYEAQSQITVPDDLQAALDASPAAKAFFATLKGANRYAILYRLHDAKRPETRARRLAQFVAMLEAGKTLHP
jgi:uncharacterized protein YdeI (YjbR/CyaY-like superfamily)